MPNSEMFSSELSRCVNGEKTGLPQLFNLNVRSAKNITAVSECFFSKFRITFDIIMVSETWCDSETHLFKLPQYKTFCVNRSSGRGGGVCYLKNV